MNREERSIPISEKKKTDQVQSSAKPEAYGEEEIGAEYQRVEKYFDLLIGSHCFKAFFIRGRGNALP
jgi:hypothetical protein